MVQYFTARRLKNTPKNELHIFKRGFVMHVCLLSCRLHFFFFFFKYYLSFKAHNVVEDQKAGKCFNQSCAQDTVPLRLRPLPTHLNTLSVLMTFSLAQ